MTDSAGISVIMPAFNARATVAEAVASALAQPEVDEMIIVDDGSDDGTLELCRQLEAEHAQVQVLQHPGGANLGISSSRNLALCHVRGAFVAFLDADDCYLPGRFEGALKVFDAAPDCDVVFEPVMNINDHEMVSPDAADRYSGRWVFGPWGDTSGVDPFTALLRLWITHTAGVTARRKLFDRVAPFDVNLKVCEDSAMWLRLAAAGRPRYACTDQPVALRRVHAASMTRSRPEEVQRYQVAKFLSALEHGRRHMTGEQQRLLRERILAAVYQQWSSGGAQWWRIPHFGAAWLAAAAADPGMLTDAGWWRCLAGPGWAWYELRRQAEELRRQTLSGQTNGPEVLGY